MRSDDRGFEVERDSLVKERESLIYHIKKMQQVAGGLQATMDQSTERETIIQLGQNPPVLSVRQHKTLETQVEEDSSDTESQSQMSVRMVQKEEDLRE